MTSEAFKAAVTEAVSGSYRQLAELSRRIHDSPEIAFEERQAAAWLTEYLAGGGFTVKQGVGGLPTAFRASFGRGKPVIAFLAEYDALPGIGHGCGHNLIATASVAAGAAVAEVVGELGGSVQVIGTPGEELLGGKAIMADKGVFDGVDMAMITHPGGGNRVTMNTLACQNLDVVFAGRAAHAAAEPELGINALEAMILSFNAVNSLRQHIRDTARIHGIITEGGQAANIVPAHTAASFMVRAADDDYLDELKEKVLNCFAGAALASGAELEYEWGVRYAAMINNGVMARLFRDNMQALGRDIPPGDSRTLTFSTDVGNVSRLVPAIQPLVGIAPDDVPIHTPGFAEAAASDAGLEIMLDAARAMAMTAVDLLADASLAEQARADFEKSMGKKR